MKDDRTKNPTPSLLLKGWSGVLGISQTLSDLLDLLDLRTRRRLQSSSVDIPVWAYSIPSGSPSSRSTSISCDRCVSSVRPGPAPSAARSLQRHHRPTSSRTGMAPRRSLSPEQQIQSAQRSLLLFIEVDGVRAISPLEDRLPVLKAISIGIAIVSMINTPAAYDPISEGQRLIRRMEVDPPRHHGNRSAISRITSAGA